MPKDLPAQQQTPEIIKEDKKEVKIEPTPQEFLQKVDALGKEMGYGLAPSIEPYLQDNGAYSFKAVIKIVKVDKK